MPRDQLLPLPGVGAPQERCSRHFLLPLTHDGDKNTSQITWRTFCASALEQKKTNERIFFFFSLKCLRTTDCRQAGGSSCWSSQHCPGILRGSLCGMPSPSRCHPRPDAIPVAEVGALRADTARCGPGCPLSCPGPSPGLCELSGGTLLSPRLAEFPRLSSGASAVGTGLEGRGTTPIPGSVPDPSTSGAQPQAQPGPQPSLGRSVPALHVRAHRSSGSAALRGSSGHGPEPSWGALAPSLCQGHSPALSLC